MAKGSRVGWFVGGVFALIGIPFALIGWTDANAAAEIEQLPLLTATTLEATSPDTKAVLEGRISETNQFPFRAFAAYVSEVYGGQDCDDDGSCEAIWIEQEKVLPRLWLDLPDGRTRLANTDYRVEHFSVTWQSSEEFVEGQTLQYRGFEVGDAVFAVGHPTRNDDQTTFAAEFVSDGQRDGYVSWKRTGGYIFFGAGIFFSTVGVGLVLRQIFA
ncbi:MAG: hypothetical protein R3264_02570 [Anaerolineae bacterium]|nr:hypothetical protein [Anaerolineae bacterium]